jgi:c-di-GMP-related signal transduction protein
VIEILEDTKLDDKVLATCQRLKRNGYLITLDDYQDSPER